MLVVKIELDVEIYNVYKFKILNYYFVHYMFMYSLFFFFGGGGLCLNSVELEI